MAPVRALLPCLTAVALGAALGACAAGPAGPIPWQRAGVSAEQTQTDFEACRGEARRAVRERNRRDADIMTDRGGGVSLFERDRAAADARELNDRYVGSCMVGRGYRRV